MRKIPCHGCDLPLMPSYHTEESRGENGLVTFREFEDVGELPPSENFDIANLVKAGVPLSETRTNILALGDSELLDHLENDEYKTEPKVEPKTEPKGGLKNE